MVGGKVPHEPPPHSEQVEFLVNIQRLLDEGGFVATYKYALLHALADLALIKGDDTGAALVLSTRDIAEKFIELYWKQVKPFKLHGKHELVILKQNTGKQAAVINRLMEAHETSGMSMAKFRRDSKAWRKLVGKVDQTVKVMPLWKLQTVGRETSEFLYKNTGKGKSITLFPGVAYCFRKFYNMLISMIRGSWVAYIRRFNLKELGQVTDLSSFLFGSERAPISVYRDLLMDIQRGSCFYCRGNLKKEDVEVDHFVPWSKYPVDLGHNFVLAHKKCNLAKSDSLAGEGHLERWCLRNIDYKEDLVSRFESKEVVHDLGNTNAITHWAYAQTEGVGGYVWITGKEFRQLSTSWRHWISD